jgi:3-oxoadipate enol-lactonase
MPGQEAASKLYNAELRDGARLAYQIHGSEGRSVKVALVHSLAMDRHFWDGVAKILSSRADILVYDCRGHGRSDKPSGPYTVEQFGDDLADLLDTVGWDRAVVAGASMGGCVALAFAARHAARVEGLGLIDTTDYYGPEAPRAWAERAEQALQGGLATLVEFQKTRWFGDRFRSHRPDAVARAIETFLANDVNAYAQACRMLGECDLRAALPGLEVPVNIVVGEEDQATPVSMARSMHERIAGSRLRVIEGARHFTPLEVPSIVADELDLLLDRVEAP